MKRTGIKRVGKSATSKLQKKCDSFLTKIAKLHSPFCECCGDPTQVGHHWIEKSRSARLRYEVDTEEQQGNIISLCHKCHFLIHNRFGANIVGSLDVANIIIKKRGKAWFNRMNRLSREIIKTNKAYYEGELERLQGIVDNFLAIIVVHGNIKE